jgi:predicted nucleic acid-binding protein
MPENESCFIDSNIWLYAFTDDDSRKTDLAQATINTCKPVVSAQVINEVCVNLIKKAEYPEVRIGELIETFYEKYSVVELYKGVLLAASELRREYSFSYWDSVIAASALAANVKTIYSEDMQDGLVIRENLKIVNPLK